jgi:hypothetical protein
MAKKKKKVKKATAKKKAAAKKSKKIVKARKPMKRASKTGKARKTVKARKTGKAKGASRTKARAAAPPRATAATAADTATANVTMTIDFGGSTSSDVQSVRRIDGITLPTGRTALSRGLHTAGWDVVSPTVKPIDFAVSITDDASGKKILDRPSERTGPDGNGAGVDTFTV